MNIYCDTPLPVFEEDICANEAGRIIAVALMRANHTVVDPTDLTQWNTNIANGNVVIIKNVKGGKPKSTPIDVDGFGRQQTRSVSRDHTLQFFHPDVLGNEDFWNVANYDNAHSLWYYTQDNTVWNTGNAIANFNSDTVVEEGLNTSIIFDVEAAWSHKDIAVGFAAPAGIFE